MKDFKQRSKLTRHLLVHAGCTYRPASCSSISHTHSNHRSALQMRLQSLLEILRHQPSQRQPRAHSRRR
jgi:hypothetical protein